MTKFLMISSFLFVMVFEQIVFSQTQGTFTIPHPQMTPSFQELSDLANRNPSSIAKKLKAGIIKDREEKYLQGRRDLILPAASYFEKFADFLRQKNTGLIRIFSDKRCDEGKVVDVAELERCADAIPLRGGGSFYSFRNQTNLKEDDDWADVHFADGNFSVGSKNVFGIIGEIGEVNLDNLTLNSKEFASLKKYKPKKTYSELETEKAVLEKNAKPDNSKFSVSLPAKVNSTYILRSIAYRTKNANKRQSLNQSLNSKTDIIVAFRVVSKENDGSLILLWKILNTKDSPAIH